MKKGDTLYMHIYNLDSGVFQILPAVVYMVDSASCIYIKSKFTEGKIHKERLGRIIPDAFDIVGKNKSLNELIVYSQNKDATHVKQAMTEYLIKQKNQETVAYDNKMRALDSLITGLENTIELEEERE